MADDGAVKVLRPGGRDYLVPLSQAAATLNRTEQTLVSWHDKGLLPLVELDGGRKSTYASFLAMLMGSARPGERGVLAEVAAAWWAAHDKAEVA